MAFSFYDRVKETSTTTGTGALTLAGAMTGFRSFSSVYTVGDYCFYALQEVDSSGNITGAWETGIGTYSAASTLTRSLVVASSNSNAAINIANKVQVWVDLPAAFANRKFKIASTTLSADALTLSATSIPQFFDILRFEIVNGVFDSSSTSTAACSMQLNGDTGSNYYWTLLQNNGNASGYSGVAATGAYIGDLPYTSSTNYEGVNNGIEIPNYTSTTRGKVGSYMGVLKTSSLTYPIRNQGAFHWNNTAAITSAVFYARDNSAMNFKAGTRLDVYGMLGNFNY